MLVVAIQLVREIRWVYLVGNEAEQETVSGVGHGVEAEPPVLAVIRPCQPVSSGLSTLCQSRFPF